MEWLGNWRKSREGAMAMGLVLKYQMPLRNYNKQLWRPVFIKIGREKFTYVGLTYSMKTPKYIALKVLLMRGEM